MTRPIILLPRGKSKCTRCLQPTDPRTLGATDGLCLECSPVADTDHWASVTALDRQRGDLINYEKLRKEVT